MMRRLLRAVAALYFLHLLVVAGCAQKPDAPTWNNPLDPAASGDPFNLRAVMGHNIVLVSWDSLDIPHISTYVVYHSLDGVAFDSVAVIFHPATIYVDERFAPGRVNYYKVTAKDAAGQASAISRVAAAHVVASPWLEIANGAQTVATRHVHLSLHATAGDTLEISAVPGFAESTLIPVDRDTLLVPWDLGEANANGILKHVWVRSRNGTVVSLAAHDTVRTEFLPGLSLLGGTAVATRRQTVRATNGPGVTLMRFALSRDSLAAAAEVTPDSISETGIAWFTADLLSADPAPQRLYAEFTSDFGYAVVESLQCIPDSLDSAYFSLAGGDSLTADPVVSLESHAVASEMRFVEGADFTGVPWQPYEPTVFFTLSPDSGAKMVYGQYRNDWFSTVTRDSIFLVHAPAQAGRGSR